MRRLGRCLIHYPRQRSLPDSQRPVWPVKLLWEHRWHDASWAKLSEVPFRLQSLLTACYSIGWWNASWKTCRLSLEESYRNTCFLQCLLATGNPDHSTAAQVLRIQSSGFANKMLCRRLTLNSSSCTFEFDTNPERDCHEMMCLLLVAKRVSQLDNTWRQCGRNEIVMK